MLSAVPLKMASNSAGKGAILKNVKTIPLVFGKKTMHKIRLHSWIRKLTAPIRTAAKQIRFLAVKQTNQKMWVKELQ